MTDDGRDFVDIAIDWGRYGELYDFDANTGQITREAEHKPGGPVPPDR